MWREDEIKSVGGDLRKARLATGYDIHKIADYLRIRSAYLLALEQDDYASLPGQVYAIGFLRTYSDFLQLDTEQLTTRYKLEAKGMKPSRDFKLPVIMRESHTPARNVVILSLILVAVLFGLAQFNNINQQPEEQIELPPAKIMAILNEKPLAQKERERLISSLCQPIDDGTKHYFLSFYCQTVSADYYLADDK